MTVKHIRVVEGNQESLSEQLMNEIRKTIMQDKYDHLTISTLIGVLEMLKLEQWERTTK